MVVIVNGVAIVDMTKCTRDQINNLTQKQIETTAEVVSDANYHQLLKYFKKHAPQHENEIPQLISDVYADDTRGMKLYLFQKCGVSIALHMSDTEKARIAAEINTDEDEDDGNDKEVQNAKRSGEAAAITQQPETKRMKSPFEGAAKVGNKHENIENTLRTPMANEQTLSARSHSLPSTYCALPSTGGWRL